MTAAKGPDGAARGSSITFTNTVKNQGTGSTVIGFSVGLFLSTDSVITTSDIRLGGRSVGPLAAGTSSSAMTTVTIPTSIATGKYFLGAIADELRQVPETNETNNAKTGNSITIK